MSEAKVQVAVRARPLSQRELEMESPVVLEMKGKSTLLRKTADDVIVGQTREKMTEFVYDYSYWSVDPHDPNFIPQEQVFSDLGKTVLEAAFEGYNACVFAYGQTGSGKTFTMMGTERAPGLIPRICETLFDRTVSGSLKKVSYKIEASFMEIYNEMVRDLLLPAQKNATHRLKVRQHPKHGPYVENLSKHPVADYQSVEELMNLGNSHRVTAATKMNDTSSRSHAIFTITFTQATYAADLPCETVSKINLVDLAGSERASATGAEGIRLKEGGNINKSLVSLGNVISALAEQSSHPTTQRHIPYRDSVLTWLLKDSLGGNSKTIMIATVSPAMCNYGETLSTLRYASRAKNIVNTPVVNEDPNVRLIRELRAEIKRLKMIISDGDFDMNQPAGSSKTVTELFSEDIQRKENQIAELTKTWAGKWEGYQNIIEDSNLALHSEGIKMTVASELPHFLAVDDDALGTGVVIYRLQDECTSIGAAGSVPKPDIELSGLDIENQHCVVEHVNGKVYLTPHAGTTSINTDLITCKIKLTHGDIVQFGSTTVFRFNHPQEAAEMKGGSDEVRAKGRLLELSPLSPKDMLEEQRLAIERHYEEKLESMRREMEIKNEHEKERLMQELEKFRISSSVEIPSVQVEDEGAPLGSPGVENDPYQVMKSIAFQPIDTSRQRTTSIRIKDITGGGGGEVSAHSDASSDSPVQALRFSPSPTPDTPIQRHELPFLSPATGQHNAVSTRMSESPIDPEMKKILETYEIVVNTNGIPSVTPPTPPVSMFDGVPDFTVSSEFDLGPRSRNKARRQMHGLSSSCPQGTSFPVEDDNTVDGLEPRDELGKVEQELDNMGELVRDGVVWRRRRGDTEKVRKLAKKLTKDVDQLRKEKEEYSAENAQLKEQLDKLSSPLLEQGESKLDYRRRSYAQPETELSSTAKHLRRSRSVGERTTRLKFSIDNHYLRGRGLTSYHVYQVSIVLGKEKWIVHKRYQDFQKLHSEMSARYPQLSTLSLPPSRWIGHRAEAFVQQRRVQLQNYMQSLVAVLKDLKNSPLVEGLGKRLTKEDLVDMSSFFDDSGIVYGTVS